MQRKSPNVSYTVENIPEKVYLALKLLSFNNKKTIRDVMLEAIDDYVEKHQEEIGKIVVGIHKGDGENAN